MTQRGAWTPQKVRDRIKTSVLAKRLQDHALGKLEMTDSQRRATEILLKKTLPDISAIELSGDAAAPIAISITDGKL